MSVLRSEGPGSPVVSASDGWLRFLPLLSLPGFCALPANDNRHVINNNICFLMLSFSVIGITKANLRKIERKAKFAEIF